jgi:hypothetical protein
MLITNGEMVKDKIRLYDWKSLNFGENEGLKIVSIFELAGS